MHHDPGFKLAVNIIRKTISQCLFTWFSFIKRFQTQTTVGWHRLKRCWLTGTPSAFQTAHRWSPPNVNWRHLDTFISSNKLGKSNGGSQCLSRSGPKVNRETGSAVKYQSCATTKKESMPKWKQPLLPSWFSFLTFSSLTLILIPVRVVDDDGGCSKGVWFSDKIK